MKKKILIFSICTASAAVLLIIFLATGLWGRIFYPKTAEYQGTRIITPMEANPFARSGQDGQITWDDNLNLKIPLEDGEIAIVILNRESEEGFAEEQFVAFTRSSDAERRVFLTYFSYDERGRKYNRMWETPTAASRPETISLYSQDIIGDRNNCIVVTGMNSKNEHTMTIFRRNPSLPANQPFVTIAELQIDGSIIIQEVTRSLAYQQGITTGQSFSIAAYGHDVSSANILDQIETIFSYNPLSEKFEQTNVARIPGSQIEQRRLRELLSGVPGVFENFINDLWYYVSPQGTIDSRQYIYFDPSGREIIFFGDEAQQIFHWHNSTPTRYGIYIRSQNISISTLLRFIDIELESLDSIKLRVVEDVRLRIAASTSWDGSYRRARRSARGERTTSIKPAVNAAYDSAWGRIQFFDTGGYSIAAISTATPKNGHYVFYNVDGHELLEFRPAEGQDFAHSPTDNTRMIYRVERSSSGAVLTLTRARLGTAGVQELFEGSVMLTLVE
ncbi:MAG: pallilysin-related adhesin [Treponema sp.]|jgi:hypothetical protein|nr:pallilysin-related adhesin [Treponema sp.]